MRTRAQPAAERFWQATAEGRFELPRCERCSAWQEPDAQSCGRCGGLVLTWNVAPKGGSVFSSMEPLAGEGQPAHTIVVVELDAGPRMMGVVKGAAGGAPYGMRVAAVVPAPHGAGRLPLFAESANQRADI